MTWRDGAWMSAVALVAAAAGAIGYWYGYGAPAPRDGGAAQSVQQEAASGPGAPAGASGSGRAAAGEFEFARSVARADAIVQTSFIDAKGQGMSLADFHGKAVLVNIWATWCGPCREEMPTLDRLQKRLGGPAFEVVALSIDRDGVDAIRPFFAELGLEALQIYVDPSAMATVQLGVLGIPTTLLLDRDGHELGRYTGPARWDSEPVVRAIRAKLGSAGSTSAAN